MASSGESILPGVGRLDYVDALRGYAALGVLAVHVGEKSAASWLKGLSAYGQNGVQLFFIASAFTLFLSRATRSGERHDVVNFFVRRFFRVAPLYWGAIALYGGGALLLHNSWRDALSPGRVILNVLFCHAWHPLAINSVVPGGWSIGVEMSFYLLIPLAHRYVRSAGRAVAVLAASVALHVVLSSAANRWLLRHYGNDAPPFFSYEWFPAQLPVFALGFLLYHLAVRRGGPTGPERRRHATAALAGAAIIAGAGVALGALPSPYRVAFCHIGLAAASFLFARALTLHPFGWIVNRPIVEVGRLSFGVYLIHFAVITVVCQPHALAALRAPTAGALNFVFLFLLTLVLTVMLSQIAHHVVERPAMRLGKRVVAWNERRAPSPLPA